MLHPNIGRLVRCPVFDTDTARGDDFTSLAYRNTLTGKIVRYGIGSSPECIVLLDLTPDQRQADLDSYLEWLAWDAEQCACGPEGPCREHGGAAQYATYA